MMAENGMYNIGNMSASGILFGNWLVLRIPSPLPHIITNTLDFRQPMILCGFYAYSVKLNISDFISKD